MDRTISADQGSYTYTGQATDILIARLIAIAQGSYTLTGQDVTLTYTPIGAYEIVCESMKRAIDKAEPLGCRVRPWIQDFPDFRFDKRIYGPADVRAQMQGSFDSGGAGYMAWDPMVKYTSRAYLQNTIDMSSSDDYN